MRMKGDFSRRTFDKSKHYSSVQMQQGRVQIDADWNEQADIFHHHLRTETQDFIGGDGVPVGNQGYTIRVAGTMNDNLSISAGRYYVNGLLFENESDVLFTTQPDYPDASLPAVDGLYLAYGEMWQRHITTLEDADLQEAALNGIDTTTRLKNIAQVKCLRVGDVSMAADSNTAFPEWDALITPSNGQLTARVNSTPTLGNQLYRVEVHQAGDENTATFKWSRDNGIVTAKIETIENDVITVIQAQQAENLNFAAGQWIELSNEKMQLHNEPGYFVRLGRVQDNQFVVSIWPDNISSLNVTEKAMLLNSLTHARRWDTAESLLIAGDAYTIASSVVRDVNDDIVITLATGQSIPENIAVGQFVELTNQSLIEQGSEADFTQIKAITADSLTVRDLSGVDQDTLDTLNRFRVVGSGTAAVNNTGFILLENGLEIKFEAGNYQSGDYWLIPARSAVNNIDWPLDENTGQAAAQLSHGEQHHYVRLALVEYQGVSWILREDCRRIFSPIVDFKQIDALQAEPNAPLGTIHVDNDGNVGIATTTPTTTLEVNGSVTVANDIQINGLVQGVDIISTEQLADVSILPQAGKIPIADQTGHIHDGWVGNRWFTNQHGINDMPRARAFFTSSVVDDIIYVFGSASISTQIVEAYDPKTNIWTQKASIPTPIRSTAISDAVNGKIYLIGGYENGYSNRVEEYDSVNNTWKSSANGELTPMPTARRHLMSCEVNGIIYVFGGLGGPTSETGLNVVEAYDPISDTWQIKSPMPLFKASGESCCVIDNKIYIVDNDIQVYDPATDTWETLGTRTPVPTARAYATVNAVNNKIYVIGGDNGGYLRIVEEYDPATDQWLTKALMPTTGNRGMSASVVNNKIYVMGGNTGSGATSNRVEIYTP